MEKLVFETWRDISEAEKARLKHLAEKILMKQENLDSPDTLRKKYAQEFEYYKSTAEGAEKSVVATREAENVIEPAIEKLAEAIKEKETKIAELEKEIDTLGVYYTEAALIANLGDVPTEAIEKAREEEKEFLSKMYSYINYYKITLIPQIKESYLKKRKEVNTLLAELQILKTSS